MSLLVCVVAACGPGSEVVEGKAELLGADSGGFYYTKEARLLRGQVDGPDRFLTRLDVRHAAVTGGFLFATRFGRAVTRIDLTRERASWVSTQLEGVSGLAPAPDGNTVYLEDGGAIVALDWDSATLSPVVSADDWGGYSRDLMLFEDMLVADNWYGELQVVSVRQPGPAMVAHTWPGDECHTGACTEVRVELLGTAAGKFWFVELELETHATGEVSFEGKPELDYQLSDGALYSLHFDSEGMPVVRMVEPNLGPAAIAGDQLWGVRPGGDVVRVDLSTEAVSDTGRQLHLAGNTFAPRLTPWRTLYTTGSHLLFRHPDGGIRAFDL